MGEHFAGEILADPADLHFGVLGAVVLIQDEDWELHDLEVDDQVPKDHGVIGREVILGEHCVALLGQRVDELFVEDTQG